MELNKELEEGELSEEDDLADLTSPIVDPFKDMSADDEEVKEILTNIQFNNGKQCLQPIVNSSYLDDLPVSANNEDNDLYDRKEFYRELPRPKLGDSLTAYECDNDEDDEGSDMDANAASSGESEVESTEDDCDPNRHRHPKKLRRRERLTRISEFVNPNLVPRLTQQDPPCSSEFQSLAGTFQKKRMNNIWAEVLKDQEVHATSSYFETFTLDKDATLIDRGPESFTIDSTSRKRKAEEIAVARKYTLGIKQHGSASFDEFYDSDCSVSSGGLSDDSKSYVRSNSMECDSVGSATKVAQRRTHSARRKKRDIQKILGELNNDELTWFIIDNLAENNTELIAKTIHTFGRELGMKLFIKTMKIQRHGGLLIKNGSRHRSPGGVFIYLLSHQEGLDKELLNYVLGRP